MKSTMKKGRKDATGTKASLDNRRGGSLLENHAVNGEVKKLKRRELNRLSACKSRKKHTEQADLLHQEHEKLEKANAALCKEIQDLQQERENLTKILKEHEMTCLLLTPEVIVELLQQPEAFWSLDMFQ